MRLLVDTHVLLWWLNGDQLTPECHTAMADPANEVLVSMVSAWELAIKSARGKMHCDADLWAAVVESGFDILTIQWSHCVQAGELAPLHSDPFDRMLIAQSLVEGLVLATRDRAILRYDVTGLVA